MLRHWQCSNARSQEISLEHNNGARLLRCPSLPAAWTARCFCKIPKWHKSRKWPRRSPGNISNGKRCGCASCWTFCSSRWRSRQRTRTSLKPTRMKLSTLANFPAQLVANCRGLTNTVTSVTAEIAWNDSDDEKQKMDAVAAWRDEVESGLPNLLSSSDIGRMQRLLARCVKLVPREYSHGVSDGKLIIPLELREAKQFTDEVPNARQPARACLESKSNQRFTRNTGRSWLNNSLIYKTCLTLSRRRMIWTTRAKRFPRFSKIQFKITARRPGDKR